jgi:hypothetical protein
MRQGCRSNTTSPFFLTVLIDEYGSLEGVGRWYRLETDTSEAEMKKVVLFLLAGALCANANLLTNPGFESNVIGGLALTLATGDTTSLPGWTVTGACGGNCIGILANGYTESSNVGTLHFLAHGGNQSLDLTALNNSLVGGLQQVISLTGGQSYALSFWVGNMDNRASNYSLPSTVQVVVNGVSLGNFTNSNNTNNVTNWQQFTTAFTAVAGNNTVQFVNATPVSDFMAGLDDVSLDLATQTSVPEPATFGFVVAGLAVAALVRRRSNR